MARRVGSGALAALALGAAEETSMSRNWDGELAVVVAMGLIVLGVIVVVMR